GGGCCKSWTRTSHVRGICCRSVWQGDHATLLCTIQHQIIRHASELSDGQLGFSLHSCARGARDHWRRDWASARRSRLQSALPLSEARRDRRATKSSADRYPKWCPLRTVDQHRGG